MVSVYAGVAIHAFFSVTFAVGAVTGAAIKSMGGQATLLKNAGWPGLIEIPEDAFNDDILSCRYINLDTLLIYPGKMTMLPRR